MQNIKNQREQQKFNRIYEQQDVLLNNQLKFSDSLNKIDKKVDKFFYENDSKKKP